MAVNHYLFTDEELIDHFVDLIECNTYIDEPWDMDFDDEAEIKYAAKRTKEYWDIRQELLERMKR